VSEIACMSTASMTLHCSCTFIIEFLSFSADELFDCAATSSCRYETHIPKYSKKKNSRNGPWNLPFESDWRSA
jgi:hypothetical protein